MDRDELALYREATTNTVEPCRLKSSEYYETARVNGRKRRAPNSTGTCWKVNAECESYLIQTLRKSTFWFQNSENYENLSKYIDGYPVCESKVLEFKHMKKESTHKEKNEDEEKEDIENESNLAEKETSNRHCKSHNNNSNGLRSSAIKSNNKKLKLNNCSLASKPKSENVSQFKIN